MPDLHTRKAIDSQGDMCYQRGMSEVIGEALRKRMDEMLFSAIGGTSNVPEAAPEPFTMDKLQAMMDRMPPKDTWLSSRLFPRDKAAHLRTQREHWTVAHPDFWLQFYAHVAKLPEGERKGLIGSFAPTILDIDHKDGESDETRRFKDRARKRYTEALEWSARSQELLSKVRLRPDSHFTAVTGV